ncbi:MAG: hypothetical protein Q4E53_13595 [Eubacteriales bacterium]|nr:hypothetical protein [Eubacteriales bacterium]
MDFNNQEFDAFAKDVKDALREVCQKYHLKLVGSRISYADVDFDLKLSFEKDDDELEVERIRFERDCEYYGFLPEDYLRTFEYHGRIYELYAFIPRAKKYKCMVRDIETGQKLKMTDRFLLIEFDRDYDFY